MTLGAALRDALSTRAVMRRQLAIVRRVARAAPDRRAPWRLPFAVIPWLVIGPPLVPLCLWFAAREPSGSWQQLACVFVFAFSGQHFQMSALSFSPTDVLRRPSKAAVLLLRLWHYMPSMLWRGACWATGCAIALGDAWSHHRVLAILLVVGAAAAPFAWTIGKLLTRLVGSDASTLGPLAAAILGTVAVVQSLGRAPVDVVTLVLGVFLGATVLAAAVRALGAWIKTPRTQWLALGPETATLPRTVLAIALLVWPNVVADATVLATVAIGLVVVLLVGMPWALVQLVRRIATAEEATGGSAMQIADDAAPRRPLWPSRPARRTGRPSLLRATLYLHRHKNWFAPGELAGPIAILRNLPSIVIVGIRHVFGPVVGALAVWRSSPSHVHTSLALLVGLTAPTFVAVQLGSHLHRLGVDYTAQARHNLRAFFLFACAPTLLAAIATGTFSGWNDSRTLALAVIAAALALRAGARGLLRRDETQHSNVILFGGAGLLVAPLLLPPPPWWLVSITFAAGIIGLVLRVLRLDERALTDAVLAQEDPMRPPAA